MPDPPCTKPRWLAVRCFGPQSRVVVIVGLFLMSLAAMGSVMLMADERIVVERRSHARRQFQFAALLAGHASSSQSAASSWPGETVTIEQTATAQSGGSTSSLLTSSQPAETETAMVSPNSTGSDFVSEPLQSQDASQALLTALTEALKGVVDVSAKQTGPQSTTTMEAPASSAPIENSQPPSSSGSQVPLSESSSLQSPSPSELASSQAPASSEPASSQTSSPSESASSQAPASKSSNLQPPSSSEPVATESPASDVQATTSSGPETSVDFSFGLLGGLTGGRQIHSDTEPRPSHRLHPRDTSALLSEQVVSLLGPLSDIVAQAVAIDAGAAARLTDVVLSALPVDASAVASTVPRVAEQASTSTMDLLPLILPAIASVLGRELNPGDGASSGGLTGALERIVKGGVTVINNITSTMRGAMSPELQVIINQVAAMVYAAANRLGEALCAISQDVEGVPLEAIIPCASATQDPASVSPKVLTLNPVSASAGTSGSASWNIIPLASPEAYGSPAPTTAASPTSSPCAKSTMLNAAGMTMSAPQGSSSGGATTPGSVDTLLTPPPTPVSSPADVKTGMTAQPTSCPAVQPAPCPTCPSCEGSTTQQDGAPDATSGPCPGSGFPCSECLNGWFCPPQQTPAQVAPCGLGWPCFHCKSGWFCIAGNAPQSTRQAPKPTGQAEGNWNYLGCFRDGIERTLAGSKPLDYLRGDVSNAKCIKHCASRGYALAGTEAGIECWCGEGIRNDAVRLPESFCEVACPGTGNEACGGSWAVSVYACAANGASPAAQPPAPPPGQSSPATPKDYGPVAGLLLAKGGSLRVAA